MLLKQLIEQPGSGKILFRDPFAELKPEGLVREVIALANSDVDGPRYIVFGINRGAMEGSGVVGIAEDKMASLKQAHRLVSALVKPAVHLAFIYDKIQGKLVGALEIDDCHDAPYAVRRTAGRLSEGQSWLRVNGLIHDASAEDFERIRENLARKQTWEVAIGFNRQGDCQVRQLEVPDSSNPPSAQDKAEAKKTHNWKQAAKEALGTVNTHIMRLMHMREHGSEAEFDTRSVDTLISAMQQVGDDFTDADNYYFFEEQAVKINFGLHNKGERLQNATLELVFPRIADFAVAERLYADPNAKGARPGAGYPEVRVVKNASVINVALGDLETDRPQEAFSVPLRLAVGPKMKGKKVAIAYTLRAANKSGKCRGRLKLDFWKVPSLDALMNEPATPSQALTR